MGVLSLPARALPSGIAVRVGSPPLPVLLVLDAAFVDEPWRSAVAHAAATVQGFGLAWTVASRAGRAAVEDAVAHAHIRCVVLCAQGAGPPDASVKTALATAARGLENTLPPVGHAPDAAPRVAVLWRDVRADRFLVSDPEEGFRVVQTRIVEDVLATLVEADREVRAASAMTRRISEEGPCA